MPFLTLETNSKLYLEEELCDDSLRSAKKETGERTCSTRW